MLWVICNTPGDSPTSSVDYLLMMLKAVTCITTCNRYLLLLVCLSDDSDTSIAGRITSMVAVPSGGVLIYLPELN